MRVLYAQALYGKEECDAVQQVLQRQALSLMCGAAVTQFEEKVAELFGKRHAFMVNSGSSANLLAIAALNLPPESEVITPALTFSTTVAPLIQYGLVPAFVDVRLDSFVIDESRIAQMITPRTRALLIPNLIGNLPNWDAIMALARRHGLLILEDSADTIGHSYDGTTTGKFSDIATTSFYGSHIITCAGFGGAICMDDDKWADRIRLLRGWGRSSTRSGESEAVDSRFNDSIDGIRYDSKFVYELAGYNFLPSEVAAAFGLIQLKRLPGFIAQRIGNFRRLNEFFQEFKHWLMLPRQEQKAQTAWLAFPLVVRDDAPFSRRELQMHLEIHGIQTRTIFSGNILRQPGFQGIRRKESAEGYPNADLIMRGGLLIGCHQALETAHLDYIFDTFRSFVAKHRS